MKKGATSSTCTIPPLCVAGDIHSHQPLIPNKVTAVVLKTNDTESSITHAPSNLSTLQFLHTADGKKILLPNVSSKNQVSSAGQSKIFILPNTFFTSTSVSNPLSSNAVSNFKPQNASNLNTVDASLAEKSVGMPQLSQPVPPAENSSFSAGTEVNTKESQKVLEDGSGVPVPLTRIAPLLKNPVVSKSNNIVFINSGLSRFKVIGNPFPVTLGKNSVACTQDLRIPTVKTPVNIAPKGGPKVCDESTIAATSQEQSMLRNILEGNLALKDEKPLLQSSASPSFLESVSSVMPAELPVPPSYLNIKMEESVKDEKENLQNSIGENEPSTMLDVSTKEEPSEDQGE